MKYLQLFLAVILFGCTNISTKKPSAVTDTLPNVPVDTVSYKDSSLNITIKIAYPNSIPQYKELVKTVLDTALAEFKNDVAKNTEEVSTDAPNSFYAGPDTFYEDDKIVSTRFVISVYFSGGAHSISKYLSINYDKRKKKQIFVADYFSFKTNKDSSLITGMLERDYSFYSEHTSDGDLWNFYRVSHIDFNISKDSLSFNFSDYELGQGPTLADSKVSKRELGSVIRSAYR
jgi:hypothetical protein